MPQRSEIQAEEEKKAKKTITPLHTGRLISLHSERYTTSLGAVETDIVSHPGAVGILPIDAYGRLLLIKQWRRAVQQVLIEIPAGTLEPHEDPIVCAQRELQEETGFRANELFSLGKIYTCPGFCTEFVDLFVAKDLVEDPLCCDDHEVIDLYPLAIDEALSLIDTQAICDAKTIASIMLYLQKFRQDRGAT